MTNKYYIIAIVLTIIWIIGFLFYDLGPAILLLLVIAFILIISRLVREE